MQFFKDGILPGGEGVYLVGGCVRDILLGFKPVDFDIVVANRNPESFAGEMAEKMGTRVICLGKNNHRIFRTMGENGCFDISTVFGGHIHHDLLNRDYTLNAIAYDLTSQEYVDVTGGLSDLNQKIVRKVSDNIFIQDPVRLLRGFRIAAGCGFVIEPETRRLIQRDCTLLQSSASERIKAEWFKLLTYSNSFPHLSAMEQTGLLFELFPELKPLKDCVQNRHHAFNVLDHTLFAYEALETLIHEALPGMKNDFLSGHFTGDQKALLKFTMLLHDVGKPSTKSIHKNGTIHFYGHASKGADLTLGITARLRASNREKDYIYEVVRHHNRPLNLFILHKKNNLLPKNITRFFMDCGKFVPDLLIHSLADHRGKGILDTDEFESFVFKLLQLYFVNFKSRQTQPSPIRGNDLMEIFNLSPSPLFKFLLNRVEEAWLSGEIKDKGQAVDLIKNLLVNENSV
ncbi:MAG: CCA tRNA nucleotidyltransferase [Desulfobacteraceae bacterium]|nr:CCA tRNA nucleotidyltransferase [Desulfobacteraceae bacterium]